MVRVLVLMSTYNGEKYLVEQINSILGQIIIDVDLMIRDDGSTDETLLIIDRYRDQFKNLYFMKGENVGCSESFMLLLKEAFLIQAYDFYAYCDQDDVWLNDKLYYAVEKLKVIKPQIPAIYFSQTQLVDENLNLIHTPTLSMNCSFSESLMIYGATGCTEVFNYKLLEILSTTKYTFISMHDTWSYQVCLALGGKVVFDEKAHILYRQHSDNVLGGVKSLSKVWKRRFKQIYSEDKNIRFKSAEAILNCLNQSLPDENKKILELIVDYKHDLRKRIILIFNKKFKTNSILNNLSFKISVLIGTY